MSSTHITTTGSDADCLGGSHPQLRGPYDRRSVTTGQATPEDRPCDVRVGERAELALRGDEGQLFVVHGAKLRSIVGREVRTSEANLDDACSFAWLQMLRYQPERERLLAWLCRTAIREAIKLDRRAQRSCDLVDGGEADIRHADTGNPVDDRLELLTAREAIAAARLRTREAEVLSLQVAGYSYTETAQLQRITPRTVERQLRRARDKLRSARRAQAS